MKNKLMILMLILITNLSYSQNGYKRVYDYDEYRKDWALVKTITGTYGFIDKSGKIVVQPIYDKIEKFKINSGEFALVKSISSTYGLINKDGKEVVKTIYAQIGEYGEIEKDLALVK